TSPAARATRRAPALRRGAWCRRWRPVSSCCSYRLARLGRRRLLRHLAAREPRHHLAELAADLFDRKALLLGTLRVEVRCAIAVLGDPLLRVRAVLDVAEDVAHLLTNGSVDDPRADGVVTVLRGVRHRVAHVAEAAFIDEVDDELHLVHALEVR